MRSRPARLPHLPPPILHHQAAAHTVSASCASISAHSTSHVSGNWRFGGATSSASSRSTRRSPTPSGTRPRRLSQRSAVGHPRRNRPKRTEMRLLQRPMTILTPLANVWNSRYPVHPRPRPSYPTRTTQAPTQTSVLKLRTRKLRVPVDVGDLAVGLVVVVRAEVTRRSVAQISPRRSCCRPRQRFPSMPTRTLLQRSQTSQTSLSLESSTSARAPRHQFPEDRSEVLVDPAVVVGVVHALSPLAQLLSSQPTRVVPSSESRTLQLAPQHLARSTPFPVPPCRPLVD